MQPRLIMCLPLNPKQVVYTRLKDGNSVLSLDYCCVLDMYL